MSYTVIGSSGFIGAALATRLHASGEDVYLPARGAPDLFSRPLGRVIYAAGVTADFRTRPFDTLRANTGLLADVLENGDFESLLYLSSARIYRHAESSREDAAIALKPADPEDLYDLTKLTAEALCKACGRGGVRVARLSNVVGSDFRSKSFLYELIRGACDLGEIVLRSSPQSTKDYVLLDDVLELLPRIASAGRHACYNLGSGRNTTHGEILEAVVAGTGARWRVADDAPTVSSRPIDIDRLRAEFGYRPSPVLEYLPQLIAAYRKHA